MYIHLYKNERTGITPIDNSLLTETMQSSSSRSWLGKLWQCAGVSGVTTATVVFVKLR